MSKNYRSLRQDICFTYKRKLFPGLTKWSIDLQRTIFFLTPHTVCELHLVYIDYPTLNLLLINTSVGWFIFAVSESAASYIVHNKEEGKK